MSGTRPNLETRRFPSNAEADAADADYWRRIPADERVLMAWRLSLEQWQLLGRTADESRLSRSVASIRRR